MPSEAKLKLSVDTSQAQQQIRLIDQQLNELGKGSSAVDGVKKSMGSASEQGNQGIDATEIERLIRSQERFIDSFTDYMNNTRQNNQSVVNRLEKINESLKTSPKSRGGGGGGDSTEDGIKGVLGKLATGATIASAIKSLISYMGQGASSSASSELQAYEVFGTTGLYSGQYDTARNDQSNVGSPYGYNVYDTLGVQSLLVGSTGSSTIDNIMADTNSALKTSRALNVDKGNLTGAFGSFYQTGTYGNGDMSKFANLFASSVLESNMVGREDEQLEILESINTLLDKNLTEITEGQYQSALGLYSMFSSSNQALSGSSGLGLVESLNEAITGGDTAMDIALGKYSGNYSSLWEYEQQKEKGISDPQNLSAILKYVESYAGDLNTDIGKHTLQKFLQSNGSDLSTMEIEEIIKNKDRIMSGEYVDFLSPEGGSASIDDNLQNFNDSKLQDMLQYEAESLNAQERIGDAVNEATSILKDLYNDLPQWLQNTISGVGGALGGVAQVGGSILGGYLGNKGIDSVKGWFSGKGAKVSDEFASYADDIVDAYNSGGDVNGLLKGLSKNGKVSDELTSWADDLVDAYNNGGSGIDDVLSQGYKSFGKNLGKASDSLDEVAKAMGSADDIAKGFSGLSKGAKALGILGTVIEVGATGFDMYQASKRDDDRDVASELGGGVGGLAGGAGGAWGGAALGTMIFPGVGTLVGGIIGGVAGGIAGDAVGEEVGEAIYDGTNSKNKLSSDQLDKITELYEETKKRYISKGNNHAQNYTLDTVVPYLNSIGVSTSITDEYNTDVGKPDFMKDYESGLFGHSLAIGLDYVPYDGFLASLHKGETILDSHTADEYRRKGMGSSDEIGGTFEIRVSGSIDGMTSENQNAIVASVVGQIKNYLGNSAMMNQLSYNNIRVVN